MSKSGSAPAPPPTRKQLSRVQRERTQRRYTLIGTGVVAALVVGIIGFGLLDQAVLQPRQPVAVVNGEVISLAEFQKAVRFQRYQLIARYSQIAETMQLFGSDPQTSQFFEQQLQQVQLALDDTATLGRDVLNNLVEDRLIRQEAARRGMTVSTDEVDALFREFFDYYPNGTPTPTVTPTPAPTRVPPTVDPTRAATLTAAPTLTPTATLEPTATSTPGPAPTATPTSTPRPTATPYTEEGYATVVAGYSASLREQANLNEADFRRLSIEARIYRDKVTEALGAEATFPPVEVHARHILVDDQATALAILEKLRAGDDWAALAAEFSKDSSNAQDGGDLGWFGRGQMVAEFEEVAFTLPVGELGEPVQTQFGWHIIQVLEQRSPETATELDQARQMALDEWLEAQRAATGADGGPLVVIFDQNWQDRVPTTPRLRIQ